jgi:hypothetical protein
MAVFVGHVGLWEGLAVVQPSILVVAAFMCVVRKYRGCHRACHFLVPAVVDVTLHVGVHQ